MTTPAALIAEVEQAMEGITEGEWQANPSVPQDGWECFWVETSSQPIASINGPQSDERKSCDARFIAWAGNGGVRRLVEDNKALVGKLREAEDGCRQGSPDAKIIWCTICLAPRIQGTPNHTADCPFAVLNEEAG